MTDSNCLDTLLYAALMAQNPQQKCALAQAAFDGWQAGGLRRRQAAAAQDFRWAGRPQKPDLVAPDQVQKRKMSTPEGYAAMLHAICHIEFNAINLALDAAYRFRTLPPAFTADWLRVAKEEAYHFSLMRSRLNAHGFDYGDFEAHNHLWDMAYKTAFDPLLRMALVPRVLEARGLDVTPATVDRFRAAGDVASAKILSRIYNDEIRHVTAGTVWFNQKCDEMGFNAVETWQSLVKSRFRGSVKPPFNDSARGEAGLTQDYYAVIAW